MIQRARHSKRVIQNQVVCSPCPAWRVLRCDMYSHLLHQGTCCAELGNKSATFLCKQIGLALVLMADELRTQGQLKQHLLKPKNTLEGTDRRTNNTQEQ